MALDLNGRDRLRALRDALSGVLTRGRSLWRRTPRGQRALVLALCLAPALVLALAFNRGASGAQTSDGDPFRASARMQRILAPSTDAAELDVPTHAPAAPAPPAVHLRGRLQMNEGPLVVLLEVEGLRGLQRLSAGETVAVRSGGVERSLRVVEDGTRDLWLSMDGGAPVALR